MRPSRRASIGPAQALDLLGAGAGELDGHLDGSTEDARSGRGRGRRRSTITDSTGDRRPLATCKRTKPLTLPPDVQQVAARQTQVNQSESEAEPKAEAEAEAEAEADSNDNNYQQAASTLNTTQNAPKAPD